VTPQILFTRNELVNGVVALPAQIEPARAHFLESVILPKPCVAVTGLGDEVVETEAGKILPLAKVTRAVRPALGDFTLQSWARISV